MLAASLKGRDIEGPLYASGAPAVKTVGCSARRRSQALVVVVP
jgi:hypothetical protein